MPDANEWDFTHTWHIEGFSFCNLQKEVYIESPDSTVEAFGNSKWILVINGVFEQKQEYISCYLRLLSLTYAFFVSFKIQVMMGNGEIFEVRTDYKTFSELDEQGLDNFITRRELLEKMKDCGSDALTVLCSMKREEVLALRPLAQKCEALTRISTDKSCIEWHVKFFKCLHCAIGKRCFYLGDMLYEAEAATYKEDVISTRRLWKSSSIVSVYGKMIILDTKGNVILSLVGRNLFDSKDGPGVYKPFNVKEGLNNFVNENLYKKNSFIIFRFEFHIEQELIAGFKAETNACFNIESSLEVMDDFRNLLTSENQSDVELKADNKIMKVHRAVLAARSHVFSAMFDTENRTETIDVSDVEENILESFVKFLYTGKVEDMDFDKTSKLLLVTENYQVPFPKEECCHFLISNLCAENVCSALALADMVKHEILKDSCMNFIVTYVEDVFKSAEWQQMMKENAKVTSEVFLYIQKHCAITTLSSYSK